MQSPKNALARLEAHEAQTKSASCQGSQGPWKMSPPEVAQTFDGQGTTHLQCLMTRPCCLCTQRLCSFYCHEPGQEAQVNQESQKTALVTSAKLCPQECLGF